MDNMVFLSPNMGEPFTTSDVIAEFAGIQHELNFKEFGQYSTS